MPPFSLSSPQDDMMGLKDEKSMEEKEVGLGSGPGDAVTAGGRTSASTAANDIRTRRRVERVLVWGTAGLCVASLGGLVMSLGLEYTA